ncbi:MAG: radical SAM domain-containing protein [Miltoncostaeaceae bacterium]
MPMLTRARSALRRAEERTRPEQRTLAARLAERWAGLPPWLRTANQSIGRRTAGCEGTHGVFPRCNLACTPCYHGAEANRVRIDGEHTRREVARQMDQLDDRRGPWQNVQLIGGEVTLLGPEAHGDALETMVRRRRKPMSMTHGDVDYDYLRRLALRSDGSRRFKRLIFAAHFDSLMFGRRGAERPESERALHAHRARFVAHLGRLRREHGVSSYLAHNMTVTPANLDQVPELVRSCARQGWRMMSFQPAAFQGNSKRWKESYRDIDGDDVWGAIERGVGSRLPYRAVQVGDVRCNRSSQGLFVRDRWIPLLDDRDPRDLRTRDAVFRQLGGLNWEVRPSLALLRVGRAVVTHPSTAPLAAAWAVRLARRGGGLRHLLRSEVRPVTFVMHRFMDAKEVRPAWSLLERGRWSEEPQEREIQERLLGCSYHMAHPETGRLVPACAQHAVFDPIDNRRLAGLLPLDGDPQAVNGR